MGASNTACWICCLVTCVVLLVASGLLFYEAKTDFFNYNTRGYINSTSNCTTQGQGEGDITYFGTINVSFFPPNSGEDVPLVNMNIPIPEICTDFYASCCSKWKGKLIYFDIGYYLNDSYVVIDLSGNSVQYFDDFIAIASVCLIVAVGFIVGGIVKFFLDRKAQHPYHAVSSVN